MIRFQSVQSCFKHISKVSILSKKQIINPVICPNPTKLKFTERTYSILVKMSSEKAEKTTKKSFFGGIKDGNKEKKITRSVTNEVEKNWREHYLKMPLEEKRQFYSCGDRFVELDKVESWPTYAENIAEAVKRNAKSSFDVDDELNMKISLWRGDITSLEIDVICNAANNSLLGGGGVDGAIHRAAGSKLMDECSKLKGCKTGSAKLTGGYKIPAKYILHTVGPIGVNPEALSSCYRTCLDIAKKQKLRSIAFPCISTGIYGYDVEKATPVVLETVRDWLLSQDNGKSIDKIIFCVFLIKDVDVYEHNLLKYFPVDTPNTELPEKKKPKTTDSVTSETGTRKDKPINKADENPKNDVAKVMNDSKTKKQMESDESIEQTDNTTKQDKAKEAKDQKEDTTKKHKANEAKEKKEDATKKHKANEAKEKKEDKTDRQAVLEEEKAKDNGTEEQPKAKSESKSDIQKKEKERNKAAEKVKNVVQESSL